MRELAPALYLHTFAVMALRDPTNSSGERTDGTLDRFGRTSEQREGDEEAEGAHRAEPYQGLISALLSGFALQHDRIAIDVDELVQVGAQLAPYSPPFRIRAEQCEARSRKVREFLLTGPRHAGGPYRLK